VLKGKLPIDAFVKASLGSMDQVLNSVRRTAKNFAKSASDVDFVMTQLNANIKEIKAKVAQLDVDISTAEKKQRDMIISVIADIIALSFASAVLLASFGVIGGPVTAAVTLATRLGLGAAATAASIKTVLDSMQLADLVALISAMKNVRRDLEKTEKNFADVQPRFQDFVNGVNAISASISEMESKLAMTLDNIELLQSLTLGKADVEKIEVSWERIGNDTQSWLDIANAQGISPVTFCIRS
jgi:septal ring factor EnvC (AmiA/AmiB activator)